MKEFLKKWWYAISVAICLLYGGLYYTYILKANKSVDTSSFWGILYLICNFWAGIGVMIGFCIFVTTDEKEEWAGNSVYTKKDILKKDSSTTNNQ